jgi:hypothetical protein
MLILTLEEGQGTEGNPHGLQRELCNLDVASKCVLGAKALRATQRAR